MVSVPGGTFTMGCTSEQGSDCDGDEEPAHQVTLSSFKIGKYEVTQAEWKAVMGENPSRFSGCDQCPVEQVSWDDVQEFLKKLNQLTGGNYRLPTEAEWEYAARGGQKSQQNKFAGSQNLDGVGWYDTNSDSKTHPVGGKTPNELGIYDMSGNVREWCADHWHENYKGAPTDGRAWTSGGDSARRVVRGGSWGSVDWYCRVSRRYRNGTDLRGVNDGFRLAQD
ncbi:MAG: formylglycine-generating enzyme family protein [Saprospirales bacterium]|nr:formylglycine-generating enzyme family protein [Saprospirales bacterium]